MVTALESQVLDEVYAALAEPGVGQTVTWTHVTGNSMSPNTSTNMQATTPYSVLSSPPLSYSQQYIDGEVIRAEDCYIVLPASGMLFVPERGDTVLVNALTFSVEGVKTHTLGSTVIAYEAQLRRAN